MSPLLDVQRRSYEIGRIRLGVRMDRGDGQARPAALESFRFTTRYRHAAVAIAQLLGGQVELWPQEDGAPTSGQWQVITAATSIPVTVPPGDAAISQWWEMWRRGRCVRRCDGLQERLSGEACMCPSDLTERAELASGGAACKPTTRVNVIVPDLPGLGVWRVETHGLNAALELGETAQFLAAGRAAGVMVPAELRLEERTVTVEDRTHRFMVPVLDVLPSLRELMQLTPAGGITNALPPPMPNQRAITAAPQQPTWTDVVDSEQCAARIAQVTDRVLLMSLYRHARDSGWLNDYVSVGPDAESMESIADLFQARDDELSLGGKR